MMLKPLKVIFLGCVLTAAHFAQADFYAGGQAGSVGWDDGNHAVSYDIYGGFQFSELLAVEIAFTDLGSFDAKVLSSTVTTSVAGASYSLVGILPIDDIFSLKGKLSYFDYSVNQDLNGRSMTKAEGGDITYSAGVDINLAENMNLSLEYRYIPLKFDLHAANNVHDIIEKDETENADNLSLGLNFWF